ncbi:MAG: hypothetical protein PF448_06290 [Bacteroidales bacterium]|jgi:hypothetical protein|nr:hypothetical protein [Bacteroidales bacterium]
MESKKIELMITKAGFQNFRTFEKAFLTAAARNRNKVFNMQSMQELIFTLREQLYQPQWDYVEPETLVLDESIFETLRNCINWAWFKNSINPSLKLYLKAKIKEGEKQL